AGDGDLDDGAAVAGENGEEAAALEVEDADVAVEADGDEEAAVFREVEGPHRWVVAEVAEVGAVAGGVELEVAAASGDDRGAVGGEGHGVHVVLHVDASAEGPSHVPDLDGFVFAQGDGV